MKLKARGRGAARGAATELTPLRGAAGLHDPQALIQLVAVNETNPQGSWFMVQGSKFQVHGSEFRVQNSEFAIQGLGCRGKTIAEGLGNVFRESDVPSQHRVHQTQVLSGARGSVCNSKINMLIENFHRKYL